MVIQWICPDCGKINSYQTSTEAANRLNNGETTYIDLDCGVLPYCDNCKKYFHLRCENGKISAF